MGIRKLPIAMVEGLATFLAGLSPKHASLDAIIAGEIREEDLPSRLADTALSTKVANAITGKLDKSGGTITGTLSAAQFISTRAKTDNPSIGEYAGTEGYWGLRTGLGGDFNLDTWNQGLGQVNALKVSQAGHVLKPVQPAFSVAHQSTFAVAASVNLIPVPTLVLFNKGGHYSTSNGRFTAPVSGVYLFQVMVSSIGSTPPNAYLSAELFKNGLRHHTAGGYHYAIGSFLVSLAAGDYVQAACESAQPISCNGGSPYPTFAGYLLG